MFESPEFWSPEVYRAKIKTPIEFVVSAARATNADVANPQSLVRALDKLGMPLYGMQTPNGYSWTAEQWVSTGALVSRMNFAVALSSNRLSGTFVDWNALLQQSPSVQPMAADASAKEARLENLLLGQFASAQTRAAVTREVGGQGLQAQAEKEFSIRPRDFEPMWAVLNAGAPTMKLRPLQDHESALTAGLLLGSPEFQRR